MIWHLVKGVEYKKLAQYVMLFTFQSKKDKDLSLGWFPMVLNKSLLMVQEYDGMVRPS